MRIQNNVPAINAHRYYTINQSNMTKSIAKLSSGYRINSAADDAAGLAISEKMRAQIRG
ncbi:MAG: flagellin, partial [Oscillospiraceae bacterium]|nr:flagellin [Oscillospiraceae bacterium]MDR3310430.1 flagellin [Oscillospiraceae bacterium]